MGVCVCACACVYVWRSRYCSAPLCPAPPRRAFPSPVPLRPGRYPKEPPSWEHVSRLRSARHREFIAAAAAGESTLFMVRTDWQRGPVLRCYD